MKKRIMSLCMVVALLLTLLLQIAPPVNAAEIDAQSEAEYVIVEQIEYGYRSNGEEYVRNRGQYLYDDFGRLSEFVFYIGEDFEDGRTKYEYNIHGELIREIRTNSETTYEYDDIGNVACKRVYSNGELEMTIRYTYDTDGNCIHELWINNFTNEKYQECVFTYNENGMLQSYNYQCYYSYGEDDPYGSYEIVEYTYRGEDLIQEERISGNLNEKLEKEAPNSHACQRIEHDKANRIKRLYPCDEPGNTIGYQQEEKYDDNGNLIELIRCSTDGIPFLRRVDTYTKLVLPFSPRKDGWTFANAAQSFAEEPASHADDYYIPRERYDALYGKAYVDAQDDLFTTEWNGNCAGMSASAILFFLDSLDWESIDDIYTEGFAYPNNFYRTVNLYHKSQSYYPAIGNNTEVTRLIEAYQLYINAIDKSRLVENLNNTYFASEVTAKKTLFGSEYIINHVPNGTYIASMLDEFQEAYEENNPLFIVLQADDFGHGIVARTDLKPEDMGDGWWRVYVYDPNKPYINESVASIVSGVEAEPKYTFGCNTLIDNGGDIFLELNPSLNQWRYCTSVNSNNSDSYIGSSPSGELLWKNYYHDTTPENKNDNEGKKNNARMPDFFYTIDLTELAMEDFANPHFSSTSSWIPENDLAIAVNGDTDCSIYASTGDLVAVVEDGDAFVLTDAGSYDAYVGQTEDGGSAGGRIYLPNDVYTVYYTSGAVQFLGNDNVLSFSSQGVAELTVDVWLNSLNIVAQEDGIVAVKCANVSSTDECSYVDTEGALVAGETFTIAYSDEDKVEASTDSEDGEFQLYQKGANQEKASPTKVIKANSLWWLWIVSGIAVALLAVIIWAHRKKK